MEHARDGLGGSSAARMMNCGGWLHKSRGLPDVETDAAKEGTLLHNAAEMVLRGADPHDLVGLTYKDKKLTDEHLRQKLLPGLATLDKLLGGRELFVENKVYLPIEGAFGTSDIITYKKELYTLTVADWKFGDGILVYADGNDQLQYYATGALFTLEPYRLLPDTITVELIIIQPLTRKPVHVSTWYTTVGELRGVWFRQYQKAVQYAQSEISRGHLSPGDWCKFCPAERTCMAKARQRMLSEKASDMLRHAVGVPIGKGGQK